MSVVIALLIFSSSFCQSNSTTGQRPRTLEEDTTVIRIQEEVLKFSGRITKNIDFINVRVQDGLDQFVRSVSIAEDGTWTVVIQKQASGIRFMVWLDEVRGELNIEGLSRRLVRKGHLFR